jgi:two-component system response regulator YesN
MVVFGNVTSKPRRVFLTFLLSYILILLIPLGIGSVVYVRAGKVIAEGVSSSELAILKEIRQSLDRGLAEIRRMCWQISLNSRIQGFFEVRTPLNPGNRLELYYLVKELRAYGSENFLLDDFYLYFRNSDRIVTPSASYEPDLFLITLNAMNVCQKRSGIPI